MALAALLVASVAVAPLYFRAMQQSATRVVLEQTTVAGRGVQLAQSPGETGFRPVPAQQPEQVALNLPEELRGLLEEPVLGLSSTASTDAGDGREPSGELLWRSDQCAHVAFAEGGCPTAANEVAVSVADARNFGLRPGRTFRATGPSELPSRLLVVGVYEQVPSDYWFGQALTGRSGTVVTDGLSTELQHDAWLTARESFGGGSEPFPATVSKADFVLDPERVGVDELQELGSGVDGLATRIPEPGVPSITVVSQLPSLDRNVQSQIEQSRVTVPLLVAQLGLLAVVVLWLVLAAVTEQRRPEVAVARLRGRGRAGARRLLLAELLPLALIAVLPGAALALLAAYVARGTVLPGSPAIELRWPFLAAVLLGALILVGVTTLAAARVAREPVDRLLRRVPPRSGRWALGATDAVLIAGAGGVVLVFAAGGLDGPAALIAPGLLAIVVGLVLAHLTTPTSAVLGRRLLRRGRVRAGVSILDAARNPATRRIVAIITLATALAVFSADALAVGQRNRTAAAEQEIGAARIVTMLNPELPDVRAALDEVDPDGTKVTPVVRMVQPGVAAKETVAVVPDEFPRIALFPGGAPDPSTWDALRTPPDTSIRLTAAEVTVDVEGSTLDSIAVDGAREDVRLGLDLALDSGEILRSTLGTVPAGRDRVSFTKAVSCRDGCRLVGVWVASLPGARITGAATLRNLTARPSGEVVPLGPAGQWSATDDGRQGQLVASSGAPEELTIASQGGGTTLLTLQQEWLPTVVPALVAGGLPPGGTPESFQLTALDGESQDATEVGTLDRVPASGPQTNVTDLETIQRGRLVSPAAQVEIWFADDDPALLAAVTRALDRRGIAVADTTTLAETVRGYDEATPTWSLQLAGLVGAVAILIALLVLLVSAVSAWRLRTRDLAALRMSGLPGRSVRRVAVAAQLPAVLVGVLAGTAAGLVGANLAMPLVPLFAVAPEVSTLDLGPAWWAAGAAALVALVVLGAGSLLIGRTLAARAELRRLREAL
ncbi:hypothetical protein GCM10027062_39400 [Nocardioides hungaricus]